MIPIFMPMANASLVEDLKSPITTDSRWILLSGTGLTLAVLASHESVEDPFEITTVQQKPLGASSKYGDALGQLVPNALYVGGMGLAYWSGVPKGFERSLVMVEATVYSALITTVLKYTIREPRPYDANVRNSFPSGHATTAFAFAGVVAAEHGWYYGAPAMAMATFVAYSRINDHQHHVHDVVAGATIGLTCAYGIYYSQHSVGQGGERVQIVPIPISGGTEIAARWNY